MRATLRVGLLLSLIALPGLCSAEETDEQDYSRSGPYIGVNGAFALQNFPNDVDPGNSFGASGRAGYRILPIVAAEAEFDWYNDFDTGSFNWSATANLKFYPELWSAERVQFYALGGLGVVTLDVDKERTEFLGKAGGGLDIYLTPHVVANIELSYAMPGGGLEGYQYAPIKWGLQFRL